jgi:3-isopropylmalate dehydrogenase
MFEPIHGSYPQAAGKDIANPIGSILSAAMLLDYLGLSDEAMLVQNAVRWALDTKFVTKDIDPINYYFTSTVGDLISDYVAGRVPNDINQINVELRKSTLI